MLSAPWSSFIASKQLTFLELGARHCMALKGWTVLVFLLRHPLLFACMLVGTFVWVLNLLSFCFCRHFLVPPGNEDRPRVVVTTLQSMKHLCKRARSTGRLEELQVGGNGMVGVDGGLCESMAIELHALD